MAAHNRKKGNPKHKLVRKQVQAELALPTPAESFDHTNPQHWPADALDRMTPWVDNPAAAPVSPAFALHDGLTFYNVPMKAGPAIEPVSRRGEFDPVDDLQPGATYAWGAALVMALLAVLLSCLSRVVA